MSSLTTTEIVAAADSAFLSGGYRPVDRTRLDISILSSARFYEDAFGIVEIIVFDTWANLKSEWPNAQASLVELISRFVQRGEAKAWEGYLVLFTPAVLPPDERDDAEEVRYNTNRVRKILVTGEDLQTITDVERALIPLLPLGSSAEEHATRPDRVFDRLPETLARRGISPEVTRGLIDAFLANQPLLERLHGSKS
jgi:hypothetical protein